MLDRGVEIRELSLNELARKAGMAKSNVYRYFESREALLLAVLWEEWSTWYAEMRATWRAPARPTSALDALVRHLAHSLAQYPLLGRLTAALPGVLEQNLSEDLIHVFKTESLQFFREIARFCVEQAPELSETQYMELLHDACVAIAGLHPFAHPAPAVARVLKAPELKFFQRDYEPDLSRLMLALAHASSRSGASP